MRVILIIVCLLLTIDSFSQKDEIDQFLKIAGYANLNVSPDLGVLLVTVSAIDISAADAIKKLNDKSLEVKNQLNSIGFKDTEIKTTNFQIYENRIYRQSESKDSGYVATQTIQLEFTNNGDTITKILNSFSTGNTDFKLNFTFRLSENKMEIVKNKLMELAINDARKRSHLIAKAAEIKLKKLIEINSGVAVNVEPFLVSRGLASTVTDGNEEIMGFTPKDLNFSEKIIMIWEFE